MDVLGITLQRLLEVAFGGDIVALGELGEAKLGLVVLLDGARGSEAVCEDVGVGKAACRGKRRHQDHR